MPQFGLNPQELLSNFTKATGGELIFRSQLTPEIRIDLANLMQPRPSPAAVSSSDATALRVIKPEIILRGLGAEKSIAPYGKPSPHFYVNVLIASAAVGLLSAGLAWRLCKAL